MKYPAVAVLFVLGAVITACASDGPPRDRPPAAAQMFISPAGEPFRPSAGAAPLRRWFDQTDADRNGGLTPAEFEADHLRFFALVDANRDGVVTPPEVSRYERDIAPEILAANDRPEAPPSPEASPPGDISRLPTPRGGGGAPGAGFIGSSRQGAGRYGLINEPQPLRAADLDYDFRITRAEWIAASARRFRQLDADKDGRITVEELRPQGGQGNRGPRRGRR